MDLRPKRLQLRDGQLVIEWNDGQKQAITVGELRKACPCATCREQRAKPAEPSSGLPVLSAAEAQPLSIRGVQPVGNYAYSVAFSDGHDTGIFTLEFLRTLGGPLKE